MVTGERLVNDWSMPEILADSESSAQQLGQLLLGPDLTVVPELVTGLVHFASLYIFYIALHPRTSLYIVLSASSRLLDCNRARHPNFFPISTHHISRIGSHGKDSHRQGPQYCRNAARMQMIQGHEMIERN